MVDTTYFQGAELGDFVINAQATAGAAPTHGTTSGYFNSSHARCAVRIQSATENARYAETPGDFNSTEFWVRWNARCAGGNTATRTNFLKIYDATGVQRLGLRHPADPGNTSITKVAVYKSSTTLLGTSSAFSSMISAPLEGFIQSNCCDADSRSGRCSSTGRERNHFTASSESVIAHWPMIF